MLPTHHRVALVIVLLAIGTIGLAGDADRTPDPFAWTPAATPAPFTDLLDDAAYAKRLATWQPRVDLAALRASTKPSAAYDSRMGSGVAFVLAWRTWTSRNHKPREYVWPSSGT